MDDLKTIRLSKKMTQKEAADRVGISLRSYISYENDESKASSLKYRFILRELESANTIDETHGILSIDTISETCSDVFRDYDVKYCYLFGSYAKGKATGESDVDLLISTTTTGLRYFEMVERLREELHKKVDLLDLKQLLNNEELLDSILGEGIRIC